MIVVGGRQNSAPSTPAWVSVVMSARNEEKTIAAAVESVLHQSHRELDLIVVDDYSTDQTGTILDRYRDTRLTVIKKTTEPAGAATSRNIAISFAKGTYVAYQDADDLSYPTRIERELAVALQEPGRLAVGCWLEERIGDRSSITRYPLDHSSIVAGFTRLTRRCTFASATMLWPADIARRFPQRPMFRYMEDWDLLCRVAESNSIQFKNIPEPLYCYVLRPKGVKMQPGWAGYNIFQRACQERRRMALPEWETFEAFECYLGSAPFDRLRWGMLRTVLQWKARFEMRALAQSGERRI